jgi:hypothetical protein
MTRNALLSLFSFVALFALTGCDDDDSSTAPTPTDQAQVRVAHLSPDAPDVDVWVDGDLTLEDVAFGDFSGYLELASGDHQVQVTQANTTMPFVLDETVTVEAGRSYTVAATGALASLQATILQDDLQPTPGQAEVRFVHASPDAPNVDITLLDGTPLFTDVAFGSSQSAAVGGGAYSLQVRVAGTDRVVLSFADVPVTAGTNYSVFATGFVADGSLDALVTVDRKGASTTIVDLEPAMASVRVGHLSPDAPNVDVVLDGSLVAELTNVPFGAVSGYLDLRAASHDIAVFLTGTTVDPVLEATLTWRPGQKQTVVATGLASDLQALVLDDAVAAPGVGKSWVRFVHASPDAPAVDVAVEDGPTLFDAIEFRQAGDYQQVDSASYTLDVLLDGNGALALKVPDVTLDSDTNYTIFAIGLAQDSSLAALPVVD